MATINFDALPDSALVRLRQLRGVVPLSPATIWRYVGAGKFPKPIKVGAAITAWRWGEVRAWLEAQSGRA